MLKIDLPKVVPGSGNPFVSAPTADPLSGAPEALDLPTTIRPQVTPEESVQPEAPLESSSHSLAQLVEAMQGAERLFQQAYRLALTTRDRETELLSRAENAEREWRHHERESQQWKERFHALDQKIPWWVRKLFRA